ncbi:MAG: IclR family transcriptional regulator [Rhizobiaceae bacterium]|nr:IclR family transcriptional regulator [Rhizobiaceae bacterium]
MTQTSRPRPSSSRGRQSPAIAEKVEKQPYGAPALEKGLDILELLAGLSHGVSQSEIAQLMGRSLQEVYRVVMVLERRGFIQRRPGEDGYFLSNRMYELAHRYPPLARLIDLATPAMNSASITADQALHIAILDTTFIRVVAQVDSPAPLGFRLRVGTKNPAMSTSSGRLLVAFQRPATKDWILEELRRSRPPEEFEDLVRRTEKIRTRGYEMVTGEGLQGITDVSFPLLDSTGFAQAVLTMPFLPAARQTVSFDAACEATFRAAQSITQMLGGQLPDLRFPLSRIAAKRPPDRVG